MLLVIQIALGIVLAFVLLRFWRIALGLGVTVAALAGAYCAAQLAA